MTLDQRLRRAQLRILHLPNEAKEGPTHEQVGPRRAMSSMAQEGQAAAYTAYSYLARYNAVGDVWQQEMLEVARTFQPDLVVWQHVGEVPVAPSTLSALSALPSAPRLLYHEGDPFGRLFKRPPAPTRQLFAASDLTLVVGAGRFATVARRAGAPRVAAVVQPYDAERFGAGWEPTAERALDAVMIGNLGGTRIPGVMLPGGRNRRRFAEQVCAALGPDRFALYGSGWDGITCARGRTPFMEQTTTIRSAWISVNWDHFDTEPRYASDRLAISLAAGVPHLTTNHPGYAEQYPGCPGLLLADSPEEGVEMLRWALDQGPETLMRWGAAAREYAVERLEAGTVWRQWIDLAVRELFPERLR